jgi:hypothetical protein
MTKTRKTFTLETLRDEVGFNAEWLTQEDADAANELITRYGETEPYVIKCAIGWAHEYARVSWCEGQDVERHEENYR